MFLLKPKRPTLRPVGPSEERRLTRELRGSLLENAYLLGLLSDYSLRGLIQMGWGRFFRFGDWNPCRGLYYLDTTGLLIPSRTTPESIAEFLGAVRSERLFIGRIIGAARSVEPMEEALSSEPLSRRKVRDRFPELGMVLEPKNLTSLYEPRLRLTRTSESQPIADSSVLAMKEELNQDTTGKSYDRLVSSKRDLIGGKRYYVLEDSGQLVFQAYLSAATREVSQIQGVYVPPSFRGRGIATRCVAEMCRRCFDRTERIALRVQKRNSPAIAVYRKVGFADFLDYLSIWYDSEKEKPD